MKLNTLFVAALCTGTLLNSCVNDTAKKNQLKYTHTSIVDGDAFLAIKTIGEAALDGAKYAEWAEGAADAKGKEVALKVKAYYAQLLPVLDSLATSKQVDFPVKGIPTGHDEDEHATDSVATAAHNHFDYVHHAQDEVSTIKTHLTRLTRNTDVALQDFAKKQLALATELFTQIGGKEDGHAHH